MERRENNSGYNGKNGGDQERKKTPPGQTTEGRGGDNRLSASAKLERWWDRWVLSSNDEKEKALHQKSN